MAEYLEVLISKYKRAEYLIEEFGDASMLESFESCDNGPYIYDFIERK